MTAQELRASIASLKSRRDRVWFGADAELARLDRERQALIQARDEEILEIDSEIGDDIAALEAIEEAETMPRFKPASVTEMWRALG